jgi:hypothetical protein
VRVGGKETTVKDCSITREFDPRLHDDDYAPQPVNETTLNRVIAREDMHLPRSFRSLDEQINELIARLNANGWSHPTTQRRKPRR